MIAPVLLSAVLALTSSEASRVFRHLAEEPKPSLAVNGPVGGPVAECEVEVQPKTHPKVGGSHVAAMTKAEVKSARERYSASKRRVKPRKDMTPVEAFHNFCSPCGKVVIPKDARQKPFDRIAPDRRKKGPRK